MKPRKPAAPGLRRGRKPPTIAIPMPVHAPYAALHAMAWPELRHARHEDLSIELSRADRCAAVEPDRRKGAKGRRKAPPLRNEIESIKIARLYIWEAYKEREPGDRDGQKAAADTMKDAHHISRRVLERALAAAKWIDYKNPLGADAWWQSAMRLARKGTDASRDKLMRFWPLHLRSAFRN